MNNQKQYFLRLLFSFGVSLFILSIIFRLFINQENSLSYTRLINILLNVSSGYVIIYLICTLIQTLFRSLRYSVLLKASPEKVIPSNSEMFLVTLTRNMFVDFLPMRLGEISYILLLNLCCKMKKESCLSSLSISILFDFMALLFLVTAVFISGLFSSSSLLWTIPFIFVIFFVVIVGWFSIFNFLNPFYNYFSMTKLIKFKIVNNILSFIKKLALTIRNTKESHIFKRVFLYSFLVRVFKYSGLYMLFLAVTKNNFSNLSAISFYKVFLAILGSEAGASLPVPTFMSFGTYESGGVLAFHTLGFSTITAALVILSLHIISQIIDYTLGAAGLILFFFLKKDRIKLGKYSKSASMFSLLFILLGFTILGYNYTRFKKQGSLKPPELGKKVEIDINHKKNLHSEFNNKKGFILWSSNRFGNHDILIMNLTDFYITQLTNDSHTETYPRISSDGTKVLYARSQIPWVSQRDQIPWDVYMTDLKSGKTELIAKNANTPTWGIRDNSRIYFQRNAGEFIEKDLNSNIEKVIYKSGNPPVPKDSILETPHYNAKLKKLAVTLRGSQRIMGILSENDFLGICDGCQLSWAPDYNFLYYTFYGGKQRNAFYKYDINTKKTLLWYDSPLNYSHEYFPKLSNNSKYLVFGASNGGHEHDKADYEIFLWRVDTPHENTIRVTFHTGNDCWPDIYLQD